MLNPLPSFLAFTAFLLSTVSCSNNQLTVERRFLMDTVVEITVADSNRARAKKAIEKAFGEIKRIDKFAGPVEGDEIKLLNMM